MAGQLEDDLRALENSPVVFKLTFPFFSAKRVPEILELRLTRPLNFAVEEVIGESANLISETKSKLYQPKTKAHSFDNAIQIIQSVQQLPEINIAEILNRVSSFFSLALALDV